MAYTTSDTDSTRRRPLTLALVTAFALTGCAEPEPAHEGSTTSDSSSGDGETTGTDDGPPTTSAPTTSDISTATTGTTTAGETTEGDTTVAVDPSTSGTTTTDTTTSGTTTTDTTTTGTSEGTTTSDSTSTGDETTTTGSTTEDSSTGEPDETTGEPVVCGEGDILDAPPSTVVDGMLAVPIDVDSVTSTSVLDWTAKAATTKAKMKFRLGPEGGHPIFDIRQPTFTSIKLDGVPLSAAQIAHRDLGGGPKAEMRVITVELPACSEHVLELEYPMDDPPFTSNYLSFIDWVQAALWSFGSSDLYPAYFVETWLPANLTHDRFKLTMTVEVLDSPSEQVVYANGDIEELGYHKWKITYPDHFRSFSPLFGLRKGGEYTQSSTILEPQGGEPVALDLLLQPDVGKTHEELQAEIAGYFDEFIESTGPYHHDRFYVLVSDGGGGMEYEGAAATGYFSLKHELFHSWFGRGLKPRHANDGWLDEAWTEYVIDDLDVPVLPLDFAAPPVVLCSANPWLRHTPGAAYTVGQQVFATISATTGEADLRLAMKLFYELRAPGLFSTAELEQHLYCELQAPVVRDVFHRFVYGEDGPTPELPPGYCP